MDIATTLRYRLINLHHFRRCMMSRLSYKLSSYSKKEANIRAFDVKPVKLSSLQNVDSIFKKKNLPSPIESAGLKPSKA